MSTRRKTDSALHDLESLLLSAPPGEPESWTLEPRIREILCLLAQEERRWTSAGRAKCLLGTIVEEGAPTWADLGSCEAVSSRMSDSRYVRTMYFTSAW